MQLNQDPIVELINVEKLYGDELILKGINLKINKGEFLTLLGPSGCGKTTILRIIGGFTQPTAGQIKINSKVVNDLAPYQRPVNTVFQNYALFPHLNVFNNIAFGLKIKKLNNKKINEEVNKMLQLVGLTTMGKRSIESLSGGQKQRVSLARALINKPDVLLLDEPLSSLDRKLRLTMQKELKKIHNELKITFIFVTHDQEEALSMSDRIVIVDHGQILQVGLPKDIYDEPINEFTATFIGQSNIINNAVFVQDCLVKFDGKEIAGIDTGFKLNTLVTVVLRPEDIDIVKVGQGYFDGEVIDLVYKGLQYEITIKCHQREFLVHTTDVRKLGEKVAITWELEDLHVMENEKV